MKYVYRIIFQIIYSYLLYFFKNSIEMMQLYSDFEHRSILNLFIQFLSSIVFYKKKLKKSQNLPFIRSETMAILIYPSIDIYIHQEPSFHYPILLFAKMLNDMNCDTHFFINYFIMHK